MHTQKLTLHENILRCPLFHQRTLKKIRLLSDATLSLYWTTRAKKHWPKIISKRGKSGLKSKSILSQKFFQQKLENHLEKMPQKTQILPKLKITKEPTKNKVPPGRM